MDKRKVLVSCYACSPYRGSEPGMGWNFVNGLSQFHEVHVIVEQEKWADDISKYMDENPTSSKKLNFYFIRKKRNRTLRKIWPPSYYWYYKQWQKKAYQLALELDKKEDFDIIHQLNMVGYREPGYLWKIDKPFVWGPIGGLENSPWSFLPSLGFKGLIFYTGRNLINNLQRNFKLRARKAAKRKNSVLIAATPGNASLINKLWKRDAVVISEVGQENNIAASVNIDTSSEDLDIVWSGQHTPGKNLPLLLHTLKKVRFPYKLHILGAGEMTTKWKTLAKQLNIYDKCLWYGWIERDKAIDVMKDGEVFCITSISDLTSTVTLEALSYGLPIVCLDHCGFAHVVNENCGIKIPVDTPENAAKNFARALQKLNDDKDYRKKLSAGAITRAKDFNWENKIHQLNSIYNSLLNNK